MHILIFVFSLLFGSLHIGPPSAGHHHVPIHTMGCGDSGGGVPGGC